MSSRILIIEDEETLRENLAAYLTERGHETHAVGSAAEGVRILAAHPYDILITDLYLEDADGIDILKELQSWSTDIVTLVMTAYGSMDSAIEAFRCGAQDFILKPISFAELDQKLDNISRYRRLLRENALVRAQLHVNGPPRDIIFVSQAMEEVMALVGRVADAPCNVLISGESGSGKERIARVLHLSLIHI